MEIKEQQTFLLLEREIAGNLETTKQALHSFCALIRKWNSFASLVSPRDADHLWVHVADSLSLLRLVTALGGPSARLLDIGSGAGFPAVPLALALPDLKAILVERSRKKAGFLENAVGELGLKGRMTIQECTFPNEMTLDEPLGWLITARAVEKPHKLWQGIRELVKNGAIFLCQWPEIPPEAQKMFHVEHIIDDWTQTGLRRGSLHIIRPHQN
jgi:16S rRNA (guanine(527)-N(7))-methyltransferase RsmG